MIASVSEPGTAELAMELVGFGFVWLGLVLAVVLAYRIGYAQGVACGGTREEVRG